MMVALAQGWDESLFLSTGPCSLLPYPTDAVGAGAVWRPVWVGDLDRRGGMQHVGRGVVDLHDAHEMDAFAIGSRASSVSGLPALPGRVADGFRAAVARIWAIEICEAASDVPAVPVDGLVADPVDAPRSVTIRWGGSALARTARGYGRA